MAANAGRDRSAGAGADKAAASSGTVRLTVDVDRSDHAALQRATLDAAGELGVARVHGQDVMKTLLRLYLGDSSLQERVLTELRRVRLGE